MDDRHIQYTIAVLDWLRAGQEILQPLAIVVLGGLFTSTALTLLVIPALYSLFSKFLIPQQVASVEVEQESNHHKSSVVVSDWL